MLLSAMNKADNETRKTLKELITNDTIGAEEKIKRVKDIYGLLNTREEAEKAINSYTRKAKDTLSRLPQNEAATALLNLADRLATRQI